MRLQTLVVAATLAILGTAPARADTFTVNSWDLGHQITWSHTAGAGGTNWTAKLDATLDGQQGVAFCVDVFHYIGQSTYQGTVLDPGAATQPGRDYAGAAALAFAWGHHLDALQSETGATYREAITGLQTGIWKTLYGDDFSFSGLSAGSQAAFDHVVGRRYADYGNAVIVDFPRNQDQVFVPNAVPEPGTWALLLLGGLALAGGRRRRT